VYAIPNIDSITVLILSVKAVALVMPPIFLLTVVTVWFLKKKKNNALAT
jgi:hypothetical protein